MLSHVPVKTAVADPDSRWEEDGAWLLGIRLRDEVLTSQTFATLPEARTMLGNWRRQYNETRPQHSPVEDEPQASQTSDAAGTFGAEPAGGPDPAAETRGGGTRLGLRRNRR